MNPIAPFVAIFVVICISVIVRFLSLPSAFKVARFADDYGCGLLNFQNVIRWHSNDESFFDEDLIVQDVVIKGVPVRIRGPQKLKGKSVPAFIYLHGGGYYRGDRYQNDKVLNDLSKDIKGFVISMTYRLIPENPFPAALDDSAAVVRHILEHGHQYKIDPERIAVGGDSVGGHLTITTIQKLIDDGFEKKPKVQVLICPITQFVDFSLQSHVKNADGPGYTREMVLQMSSLILVGNFSIAHVIEANQHVSWEEMENLHRISLDRWKEEANVPTQELAKRHKHNAAVWNEIKGMMTSPYVNPLLADDLAVQPTAYVITAEKDVYRDDGYLFVKALNEARVDNTHYKHPSASHETCRLDDGTPEAKDFYTAVKEFLRLQLQPESPM